MKLKTKKATIIIIYILVFIYYLEILINLKLNIFD